MRLSRPASSVLETTRGARRLPAALWWVTLLLVAVTVMFPHLGESGYMRDAGEPFKWRVLYHFNLAVEMNGAAWWSSLLLLLNSLMAYQRWARRDPASGAWMILAVAFALLSLDEIGSLHEFAGNLPIGNVSILVLNAPLAGAALLGGAAYGYACWRLWRSGFPLREVGLLLVGAGLLGSAVINEYFEHHLSWPGYLVGARSGFEEGLEVLGMLVCLGVIADLRSDDGDGVSRARTLWLRLESGRALGLLVGAPFLLHLAVSWLAVRHMNIGPRGNPAVWYPMAMFVVLALAFGWKATQRPSGSAHWLLATFFLASSVGVVYEPRRLFLAVQLAILFAFYVTLRLPVRGSSLALAAALVAIPSVAVAVGGPLVRYDALGAHAGLVALLFLSAHEERRVEPRIALGTSGPT
jgi:hypothetical protein